MFDLVELFSLYLSIIYLLSYLYNLLCSSLLSPLFLGALLVCCLTLFSLFSVYTYL